MMNQTITEEEIRHVECEREGLCYVYRLMESEAKGGSAVYSLSVEMTLPSGEVRHAEAHNVFFDAGRALAFFSLITHHLATPTDLPYVLEDAGVRC